MAQRQSQRLKSIVQTEVDINSIEKENSIFFSLKFVKVLRERQIQCRHGVRMSAGHVCCPVAYAATWTKWKNLAYLLFLEAEQKVLSLKDSLLSS